MTKLDAKNMPAKELCARIRESTDTALAVEHVNGQRYIAAGLGKKELTLTGTPWKRAGRISERHAHHGAGQRAGRHRRYHE